MILDKFRKFEFVNIIEGAHNINFILKERIANSLWIGKISKNLKNQNANFIDLDNRAILAYRLGEKLKTCIPTTKFINYSQIKFSSSFDEFLKSIKPDSVLMRDKLLITRFEGVTLSNFVKYSEINKIKNLRQILNNFIFNLWVGNYDKKDQDYVINNNLVCRSIDYNLSGPGFLSDKKLALGAYAQSYSLDEVEDSGWAIAPIFCSYIKQKNYKVSTFEEEISKIENIRNDDIKKSFEGLNFYRESSKELINEDFMEFLIERKSKIREVVKTWCENEYPRGRRPKSNPEKKDISGDEQLEK